MYAQRAPALDRAGLRPRVFARARPGADNRVVFAPGLDERADAHVEQSGDPGGGPIGRPFFGRVTSPGRHLAMRSAAGRLYKTVRVGTRRFFRLLVSDGGRASGAAA